MCEETKREKEKIGWVIPLIIIALVISSCWATWFFLVDEVKRGTFGDMFGVTNAFFSGLAFGGVIYAIILQRRELRFEREELELTRIELKWQKPQLKTQNTTLKKQNFESTFFQLLRLHNETTNSIEHEVDNQLLKGSKCLSFFFGEFTGVYGSIPKDASDEEKNIVLAYKTFYVKYKHEVSHYFRTIFAIVDFIENSVVENVELYVNMIRVQLTDRELLLLFYHSLSSEGKELKPLIEKYALLKSLPTVNLLKKEHKSLYAESAYIP